MLRDSTFPVTALIRHWERIESRPVRGVLFETVVLVRLLEASSVKVRLQSSSTSAENYRELFGALQSGPGRVGHCGKTEEAILLSFSYSALACRSIGISGSASFQVLKNSS